MTEGEVNRTATLESHLSLITMTSGVKGGGLACKETLSPHLKFHQLWTDVVMEANQVVMKAPGHGRCSSFTLKWVFQNSSESLAHL